MVRAFDELGADGVVFETNYNGLYLGDEALTPLYAELNRRAAVLFVHPTISAGEDWTSPDGRRHGLALGYPPPMLEFIFDTTRAVAQLVLSGTLVRNPRIRVLVPHDGAALPILVERIRMFFQVGFKPSPDTPADLRAALAALHYDLAGVPVQEMLGALLGVASPTNLHYGSDWPFTPVNICENLARMLDQTPVLDGALREAVMVGNAANLLDRTTLTPPELQTQS